MHPWPERGEHPGEGIHPGWVQVDSFLSNRSVRRARMVADSGSSLESWLMAVNTNCSVGRGERGCHRRE